MKVTEPVVQRKKSKKLEDKEGDKDMVNLGRREKKRVDLMVEKLDRYKSCHMCQNDPKLSD